MAQGRVVHRGRTVATAESRLLAEDGTLYAHATSTCLSCPSPSAGKPRTPPSALRDHAYAGAGPLIVFLHGFPQFHYAFRALLRAFSADHLVVLC